MNKKEKPLKNQGFLFLLQYLIRLNDHLFHIFCELFKLLHGFPDAFTVIRCGLNALDRAACHSDQILDGSVEILDHKIDILNCVFDLLVILLGAADRGLGIVRQLADTVAKLSFMDRLKRSKEINNTMTAWTYEKQRSCYVCRQYEDTYARYLDTFFYMYKKDADFVKKLENSKGFCLVHFGDLCQSAVEKLNQKQCDEFFAMVFPLMEANLKRLEEDVSWMVEKFDYRNADADWKNSKDAIQRGMQKLKGGYPAAPVYQQKK